nr:GNAT family N-acetyltransferase [Litchfieldia alkalitelluris]
MTLTLSRIDTTTRDGSTYSIRPVVSTDANQIILAVKEIIDTGVFIQKEAPRTLQQEQQFIEEVNEKNNMYVAVLRNEDVVGIARVLRGELDMKRHVGIFRTWLVESAQGLGIGKQIMEYTFDWCRTNQLRKLCLTVFASNDVAFSLYSKYGFLEEGRQKDQVFLNGKYDDEIWMAKFFT